MVHFGYKTDNGLKVICLYSEKSENIRDFLLAHRALMSRSKVIELVELGNRDYLNEYNPIRVDDVEFCEAGDYDVLFFLDLDDRIKVRYEEQTLELEEFLSPEESKRIRNRHYSKLRKIEDWEDHNSFLLFLQDTYDIEMVSLMAEYYSDNIRDGITLDSFDEIIEYVKNPGYMVICEFDTIPVYDDECDILKVLIIDGSF